MATDEPTTVVGTATLEAAPDVQVPVRGNSPRMGDLLVNKGMVTRRNWRSAWSSRSRAPASGWARFSSARGMRPKTRSWRAWPTSTTCPSCTRRNSQIPEDVVTLLPADFCRRHKVLPIEVDPSRGTVTVATPDPANVFLLDEIRRRLNRRVRLAVTTTTEVSKAIEDLLGKHEEDSFQLDDLIRDITDDAVEVVEDDGRRGGRPGPVGRRVAGHPPGELPDLQRGHRGRQRHPHRAGREEAADPVPHRRRPLRGHEPAADDARRPDLAA